MRRSPTLASLCCFATVVVATFVPVSLADDGALVAKFYPPELAGFPAMHPTLNEIRQTAMARVDLDGTGRDEYLAVVYSNGISGYFRLLRGYDDDATLVAAPEHVFFDENPSVEARELDGDRRPEIVISLSSGRGRRIGPRFWIFRWNEGTLTLLRASTEDPEYGYDGIRDAAFMDLDGDGTLEVVAPRDTFGVDVEFATPEEAENAPEPIPDMSYHVWKVGETELQSEPDAEFLEVFSRRPGSPVEECRKFRTAAGKGVIQVRISSMGAGAATVVFNGTKVTVPGDFASDRLVISKEVLLQAENVLSVQTTGTAGGEVVVMLRRTP